MGKAVPVRLHPDQLIVRLLTGQPGVAEFPARPDPVVIVHAGKSVHVACDRAGRRHRGVSVHGDVDIIPAGVSSRWEIREKDAALALVVPASLLRSVAMESGADPDRVEIVNRFQTRDAWVENIAWALKAEMETGYSNGRLYLDGLATALTIHLLNRHSSLAQRTPAPKGGLSGRRLRQVIGFIEDNLGCDLSLQAIAQAVGLSASHCKTAFRASLGQPIHQYVIQRRVERARTLLCEGKQSISQIALETGFAHQSHLALHMRRVLGISPGSIVREEQRQ